VSLDCLIHIYSEHWDIPIFWAQVFSLFHFLFFTLPSILFLLQAIVLIFLLKNNHAPMIYICLEHFDKHSFISCGLENRSIEIFSKYSMYLTYILQSCCHRQYTVFNHKLTDCSKKMLIFFAAKWKKQAHPVRKENVKFLFVLIVILSMNTIYSFKWLVISCYCVCQLKGFQAILDIIGNNVHKYEKLHPQSIYVLLLVMTLFYRIVCLLLFFTFHVFVISVLCWCWEKQLLLCLYVFHI